MASSRARFGDDARHQLGADGAQQHLGEALAELEDDVAHEAVADHHIHRACVDVAPLDVADEVDVRRWRRRLDKLVRLLRKLVALGLFFAVRQQPYARIAQPQHALHVDRAHQRELEQVGRLAVGVRADIQHEGLAAARCWHHRAERGPVDPAQAAEGEDRGGHHRAAIPSGDRAQRLAVAHQLVRRA